MHPWHALALCGLALTFIDSSTVAKAASYAESFGETSKEVVRRDQNVDHWDADTLAYFLDNYPGYDAVVLFYASWDQNSRQLSPMYGRIAGILEAGTTKSRLIMSVFDCEKDHQHHELCGALSIQFYPTIMFIGSGEYHDTDPVTSVILGRDRSAGVMGHAPAKNTVKFQGNWQYGTPVLDWIRTMQALSNWHQWNTQGFGRRLRNFFLFKKPENHALPVGIPANRVGRPESPSMNDISNLFSPEQGSSGASTGNLQNELSRVTAYADTMEKTVNRASLMIDKLLESKSENTDMFNLLYKSKGWELDAPQELQILRTCVIEVSLDYCQRVATHVANAFVDEIQGSPDAESQTMESLEKEIESRMSKVEPYCMTLEKCIPNGMEPKKDCQPESCPFVNQNACRYLETCLEPSVQQEYEEALFGSGQEAATTS